MGSGKSSIVNTLLGEMYRLSGEVFVPRKVPLRVPCPSLCVCLNPFRQFDKGGSCPPSRLKELASADVLRALFRILSRSFVCFQVSYTPQQAWLLNDTVKGNILFGSPFNQVRPTCPNVLRRSSLPLFSKPTCSVCFAMFPGAVRADDQDVRAHARSGAVLARRHDRNRYHILMPC